MSIQIKASDIVRLVLQFLKQNNFEQSFRKLQEESGICINMVDKDHLKNNIMLGKWDSVLDLVSCMLLPSQKLIALYELIIEDMIEHDEPQGATFVLNTLVKNNKLDLKSSSPEKVARLEYLCQTKDKSEIFKDAQKQKKKQNLIKLLESEVREAPEQRLMKLLAQSIKYQVSQGAINPNIKLDFFADYRYEFKQQDELVTKTPQKIVKYPEQSKIQTMVFSNLGQHLVLGCVDGLIEVYDPVNFQLNTHGLPYQNEGNFMFHNDPITALAFNDTDEMLASGDKFGHLKVWNITTGKCLRKMDSITTQPISALSFGIDPSHVLSAYDTISLYGLKSGKVLKEFKGHEAYINSIVPIEKMNQLITCSKDGSIKFWNYSTQEIIKSYSPSSNAIDNEIHALYLISNRTKLLVCVRGNSLVLTQPELKSFESIVLDNREDEFTNWAVSQGNKTVNYIYSCVKSLDERLKLVVHNLGTRRIEFFTSVDSEISVMVHHPNRNLLVTFSKDGQLTFWRP